MTNERTAALLRAIASPAAAAAVAGGWIALYVTVAVFVGDPLEIYVLAMKSDLVLRAASGGSVLVVLAYLVATTIERARASRIEAALRFPLEAGLWLLVASMCASTAVREIRWGIVGRGNPVPIPWSAVGYTVEAIDLPLREVVSESEPPSHLLAYAPHVVLRAVGGETVLVGAWPPANAHGTRFNILQFGIAPIMSISRESVVVAAGPVMQRLLPPGVEDTFDLPDLPYEFRMRLEPRPRSGPGAPLSYDLKDPTYLLEARLDGRRVFSGSTSNPVSFEGLTITFAPPVGWVWLQCVSDPTRSAVIASLLIALAGAPTYLIGLLLRHLRLRAG